MLVYDLLSGLICYTTLDLPLREAAEYSCLFCFRLVLLSPDVVTTLKDEDLVNIFKSPG